MFCLRWCDGSTLRKKQERFLLYLIHEVDTMQSNSTSKTEVKKRIERYLEALKAAEPVNRQNQMIWWIGHLALNIGEGYKPMQFLQSYW